MTHRFGFDAPKHPPLEDSILWAAQNNLPYIDFQADLPPNDIASFDNARIRKVRNLCEKHGVEMPIAQEVFQTVQDKNSARRAFRGLLKTTAGAESDPG